MPRSHPPTLITLADRALRDEIRIPRGARVMVAVSGGADSMALLSVLARLAPKHGWSLLAHGVDHGLRPEAGAELDLAERFATSLGVPFGRTAVQVAPGGNLQARARAARYAALSEALDAAGGGWLATAHHADDRAETVLMRLLRGTSPQGLAVLPPRAGNRVRPLIRARKSDVLSHVERHRVPFAEDPSNQDLRFMRVRVRRQVIPLLESLSPRVVDHLNALADELLAYPPSCVVDAPGHETETIPELSRLGIAQRAELRRMMQRRSPTARVRIRGGYDVGLDASGALVVEAARPPERRRKR